MVYRVNKHLIVGSRGCHGLIPYNGGRDKPSVWGGIILDFGRGACRHRRGTGAQAHVTRAKPVKTYASEPPARQAPMIHGIQFWLCSGRSSVRFGGFDSFGGTDMPSLSAAPTGGRNDSLAA